jgi:hypothetical protein
MPRNKQLFARLASFLFCTGRLAVLSTVALSCPLLPAQTSVPANTVIINFDPPGSVNTTVMGINTAGTVVGYFADDQGNFHGFSRSSSGQIAVIDAAGPTSRTTIYSINDSGEMAGDYYSNGYLGFTLDRFGNFTSFSLSGDAPFPYSINNDGLLAGIEIGGSDDVGFTRNSAGDVTLFLPPDAIAVASAYIDASGRIAGSDTDAKSVIHGYVRDQSGSFISFNAPDGGTSSGQGTWVLGLLSTGLVTVGHSTDDGNVAHGFIREGSGSFTIFNVAGAGTSTGEGTFANCINLSYTVSGYFVDSRHAAHGFVRDQLGNVTKFDDENAGTGENQGTVPGAMNSSGQIAGTYVDSNGEGHGFLRLTD